MTTVIHVAVTIKCYHESPRPGGACVGSLSNKCNPSAKFGFGACLSSRKTTVIHVAVTIKCYHESPRPGGACVGSVSNKCNPSAQFGFGACISSRMTTVIHVAVGSDSSDHQINYNCDNEPFALSPCQSLHGDMQPKPKTQNPGPRTQNRKPKTQNPQPKTQNPKPKTQKKPWGDAGVANASWQWRPVASSEQPGP